MKLFDYIAPDTLEEAVAVLDRGGAAPLAGGTDLLPQIRGGAKSPDMVLNLKLIPELTELKVDADGVFIGAAVPCYRIYEHKELGQRLPAVTDAVTIIGGIQIQSRASLGGNLCNSSPSADGIAPLMVLGANALIAGPKGRRTVAVTEFCTAPGVNVLAPNEVLVGIEVPSSAYELGAAYERFTPRNEMDIAVAGVAVALKVDADNRIELARAGLAGVGPTPITPREACEHLIGATVDDATIAAAAEMAAQAASPIDDIRGTVVHRRQLVKTLFIRTAKRALERHPR